MEELEKFGPDDSIGIVSLMDHTPGQRQFRDVTKLKDYVMGKHGYSADEFVRPHRGAAGAGRTDARPARGGGGRGGAAAMARFWPAMTTRRADQVARSAAHGAHFAEFPTTVEAAQACHAHGIKVMMGAPNLIRGGSHSGNVAAQTLAEAGLLDIVSSDYVPSALLTAALRLGDLWGDLARGVATVTQAPAAGGRAGGPGQPCPGDAGRCDPRVAAGVGGAGAGHLGGRPRAWPEAGLHAPTKMALTSDTRTP